MLTKTITYDDLDDQSQTETYHFRLTEAEVTKNMIVGGKGGETFQQRLNRLATLTEEDMNNGAGREVMDTFEDILKAAVGRRVGQQFIKNEETTNQFLYSGAYDAFFMEMLTQPDSGASIIKAILPKKAQDAVDQAIAKQQGAVTVEGEVLPASGTVDTVAQPVSAGTDEEPAWLKESRYPTPKELMRMNADETRLAMKMKSDKAFG